MKIHTTKHEGKIALITGGTSGIGLATAQRLALEGATVVVTGRRQPELDAAVQRIGHNASGVRGDIADLEHLDVLVGAIKGRHGRLDMFRRPRRPARLESAEALSQTVCSRSQRYTVGIVPPSMTISLP